MQLLYSIELLEGLNLPLIVHVALEAALPLDITLIITLSLPVASTVIEVLPHVYFPAKLIAAFSLASVTAVVSYCVGFVLAGTGVVIATGAVLLSAVFLFAVHPIAVTANVSAAPEAMINAIFLFMFLCLPFCFLRCFCLMASFNHQLFAATMLNEQGRRCINNRSHKMC